MLSRISNIPRRHPLAFGIGLSAIKTSAADAMAQLWIEKRDQLDRRRTFVFGAWGALYLGGVQYFVYVHLFSRVLFPSAATFVAKPLSERLRDRVGQVVVLKQVALDQFIHHPFILFPAFYCVKEFIEGGALGFSQCELALNKYQQNFREDCMVCWRTWVPTFLINFSVCPIWARVPFVAVVSLGYMTYWSFLRGSPQPLPNHTPTSGEACQR